MARARHPPESGVGALFAAWSVPFDSCSGLLPSPRGEVARGGALGHGERSSRTRGKLGRGLENAEATRRAARRHYLELGAMATATLPESMCGYLGEATSCPREARVRTRRLVV